MGTRLVSDTTRTCTLTAASSGYAIQFGYRDDATGIDWFLNDIDYGGDITSTLMSFPNRHGGVVSSQFLEPRVMTLKVTAVCPSLVARDYARDLVRKVLPFNNAMFDLQYTEALVGSSLLVDEPTPKYFPLVFRSGRILERRISATSVEFTIGLVSPDPRALSYDFYSIELAPPSPPTGIEFPVVPPIEFPASSQSIWAYINNEGNIDAAVTALLVGPQVNPGIVTSDGRRTLFNCELYEGDTLDIRFDQQYALYNGSTPVAATLDSTWITFPSGLTIVAMATTSFTGLGSISWRYGYEV